MAKKQDKQKSIGKKALAKELKALSKQMEAASTVLNENKAVVEELRTQGDKNKKKLRKAEARIGALEEEVRTLQSRTNLEAPSETPDESWTVAQLRAEARRREVPGYSNKNKAALLVALG